MAKFRIKGRLKNPVVETEHVVVLDSAQTIKDLLADFDPKDPDNPANGRLLALLESAESHTERVTGGEIEFEGLEAVEMPHFTPGTLVRERNGPGHVTWKVVSVRESDHALRLTGPGAARGITFRAADEMEPVVP